MISKSELIINRNPRYLGRNLYRFRRIHSSNLELLDADIDVYKSGDIVLADEQSSGLGRYKRHWVSDYGGLYFSILFEDVKNLAGFYPFVILCALAILKESGQQLKNDKELKIKWPNDIYYQDKKLCGILVQSKSSAALSRVVIGIGINLNNALPDKKDLRNPAVSLSQILKKPILLNSFFQSLILNIDSYYHEFIQGRFIKYLPELNQYLYKKNQKSQFQISDKKIHITPLNFTVDGQLSAEFNGNIKTFSYGEFQ